MHAMALRENLSPAVILQETGGCMSLINKAQTKDDLTLLEDFICDALLAGYAIVEWEEK